MIRFFRFWRRGPSSAEILDEMTAELIQWRRSERHCYALRNDLMPFIMRFPRIEKVTQENLRIYFQALGERVGARRRDNVLMSVQQFSRFARGRGYLPEDRRTLAEKIRRINAPRPDVQIWAPAEAKALIDGVRQFRPRWLGFIAIALFAGLRNSEILRLEWEQINFDQGVIVISRHITKTRSSRAVPIQENLAAWLRSCRERVGAIRGRNNAEKTSENQLFTAMGFVRRKMGLPAKNNACRHSFGAYRMAILHDYAKVAFEMGNSPRAIAESYYSPQSESAGQAYFNILPPEKCNESVTG